MSAAIFAARLDARACRVRIDRLLGLPAAGIHIGGGRHVPMPASWDGSGLTPFGWTRNFARVRKHPVRQEWSVQVEQVIDDALNDGRAARLTPAERDALRNQYTAAQELDGSWDEAEEDDT